MKDQATVRTRAAIRQLPPVEAPPQTYQWNLRVKAEDVVLPWPTPPMAPAPATADAGNAPKRSRLFRRRS